MVEHKQRKSNNKERVVEQMGEKPKLSKRFIPALILSVIAVGILIMLILVFPVIGANFFYGISYDGYFSYWIYPQIGVFIFIPLVMILLPLSGLILLPKKFGKQSKILIYCNWALYLVAMVVGIVKGSTIWGGGWGWVYAAPYLGVLGVYPFFLNFFIQLALLLEQKSFRDWAGFSRKDYPPPIPTVYLRKRRINAGFFLFFYVYLWSYGIGVCFGDEDIALYGFVFGVAIPAAFFMLLWFVIGELIVRKIFTTIRLLKDIEANKELFDNPLFLEKVVRPHWKSTKKKLVLKQIAQQDYDLQLIAKRTTLPIETVRDTIRVAAADGKIMGTISEDGQTFIPKKRDETTGELVEQPPEEAKIDPEALLKRRIDTLRKIIKRYGDISLEKMAQLLEFSDVLALEKWLLELPEDIAFRVQGNKVVVPKELQTGTEEAEKAIDELLARFEEYERQTRGKV